MTYSIDDICRILSISKATARNWIRLGKLTPDMDGQMFSSEYTDSYTEKLRSEAGAMLKSRRNKTSRRGRFLYNDYVRTAANTELVSSLLTSGIEYSDEDLRIILANFAVQLFCQKNRISCGNNFVLEYFLSSDSIEAFHQKAACNCLPESDTCKNHTGHPKSHNAKNNTVCSDSGKSENSIACPEYYANYKSLIIDLLGGATVTVAMIDKLMPVLSSELIFTEGEDSLGFVYISLSDIGRRKKFGAYYTPEETVDGLLGALNCCPLHEQTIFDPCCGTGNFLLRLGMSGIDYTQVSGEDIDAVSVCICRINIALMAPQLTADELRAHIKIGNTLLEAPCEKYDVILGNPPWGSKLASDELEIYHGLFETAKGKGIDICDLFVEKALSMLKPSGMLAFVVPESILTVNTHKAVRKLIADSCTFSFVSYLGNVFAGVQCPSVILGLSANDNSCHNTVGCKVKSNGRDFVINQERAPYDSVFPLNMTDEEYDCLRAIESIEDAAHLKGHARFALGIVTGDNKRYISTEKRDGYEPILRGSDICKYCISTPKSYIRFSPENFQQTAPAAMYRAKEKLVYRFVSDTPVFAYDDRQLLTLNSCNIVIPEIPGLAMKYVLAILNSSVATYYMSMKFRSVKLLRSHLEQLPIPVADWHTQDEIIQKTDRLISSEEDISGLYKELDDMVMGLYGLGEGQIQIIRTVIPNSYIRAAWSPQP